MTTPQRDKINISIRIADYPRMHLSVPPQEEEIIRRAEASVNDLWRTWTQRFSDKSPCEILAMVTFRFAQLYFTAEARTTRIDDTLASLEAALDRAILRTDPQEAASQQ